MPLKLGIWRLGSKPARIAFAAPDLEKCLEDALVLADQNSACRLRNQFTLERLIQHFGLGE